MANRTKEEILALANTDPELLEVMKTFEYPSFPFDNPPKALEELRWMVSLRDKQPPDPEVAESKLTINARDGFELRLLVFKPASPASASQPLMVFYHGGGGTLGAPENMIVPCRNIVKQFGAVVVAPQYRLAPEHRWPTGHEDAWDALKWIAANAESLGADPTAGFVVGGVSNGGSITGVISHMARDEKLSPPLTGVYLAAASFVTPAAIPEKYADRYLARSQDACLDSPVLNRPMKKFFDDSMRYDPHSPMFASLLWPTGHAGLPPAYFQVCGMDINRDDSLIYEQVLREECGVKTRIDVYPGVPHIFWGVYPMLAQTRKWQVDTVKGLGWLFGREAKM